MKKLVMALAIVAMCGLGISCSKADDIHPEEDTPVNVPQRIIDLFPTATSMNEVGSLITVKDKDNQVLGYVLNSKPASNGIEGRYGETPLEIIFDGKKVVNHVEMLPNQETPSFVNIVVKSGLLKSWDGLGVEAALNKDVDAVSGATYTSNSVIKTFRVALRDNMK